MRNGRKEEGVTNLTGNAIEPTGEFTTEDFFQSLEKIEIEFDKDGNPIFPIFMGSPDTINKMITTLRKEERDEIHKGRMDEIVKIKRQEWRDKENSKKLVD